MSVLKAIFILANILKWKLNLESISENERNTCYDKRKILIFPNLVCCVLP